MIELGKIGQDLEQALGREFVSLYLVGTYGTDRQIETSDVDLILIVRQALTKDDFGSVINIRDGYRRTSGVIVDINPRPINVIIERGMAIKLTSRFIHGTDIRHQIKQQEIDDHIRQKVDAAVMFTKRWRKDSNVNLHQLTAPDPSDEFFGYLSQVGDLPLKDVMSLTFHAGARVVHSDRHFLLDKHDIPSRYETAFTDWTVSIVNDLFNKVRAEWGYRIPSKKSDRSRLRGICERMPEFESLVFREVIQQGAQPDAFGAG